MKRFINKRDILIILLLAAAAAACLLLLMNRNSGAAAVVEWGGVEIARLPLSQNGVYAFECDITITLEVRDNAVRFINPLCPDHVCAQYGWLKNDGDFAVCMPARAIVKISE